jgi:protoporphyrinogen oxidase
MPDTMSGRHLQRGDTVLIIGAGPAGLTAATEVLARGGLPLVIEVEAQVGGLARTLEYRGNRIDIGGHRFFSRDDSVMRWWLDVLPLQGAPASDDIDLSRSLPLSDAVGAPDPEKSDEVMLSRTRLSRIYFLRRFFDYPVTLSLSTLRDLGFGTTVRIIGSYLAARLRPIRPELNLADYFINRFGRELYQLLFEDYTHKVWGVPCSEIGPEWGAQRVRGLSVGSAIKHAVASLLRRDNAIGQEGTPKTLIGRFLYPKLGPGQLWEAVAARVLEQGGRIMLGHEVVGLRIEGGEISDVRIADGAGGHDEVIHPDFVLSSMPLCDLVARIEGEGPPEAVSCVARELPYRDFLIVGLLVRRMKLAGAGQSRIPDNWLYVQERDVRLGRLQVFNNWSPYLVEDGRHTWLGLEYFCSEGDEVSGMQDDAVTRMAVEELEALGLVDAEDLLDSVVIRVKKAYPGYFGAYADLGVVRDYVDGIDNLYVMGRNGMHRYNNMDHSMLSARAAVSAMCGEGTREQIWLVNAEGEHHEAMGAQARPR